MVIECDYASYYHHPPPVRVYGKSQSKFSLSSPWKREFFVSFGISVFSGGLASIIAPACTTKRKKRKHSLEERRPGRQPRHGCGSAPGSVLIRQILLIIRRISSNDKKKTHLKYPPISASPIGGN